MPLTDAVAGLTAPPEDIEGHAQETEVEVAPDTLVAELRARVQAGSAVAATIDLEVPGFSGKLWGRYQPIPLSAVYKVRAGGQVANPLADPRIAADALGRGLVELLGRDADGQLVPLADDPVRFDDTLVELLSLQPAAHTARAVVFALFAHTGRAEGIIVRHFGDYYSWLSGEDAPSEEVIEDAVGESIAG